jgi:hypothetical protein
MLWEFHFGAIGWPGTAINREHLEAAEITPVTQRDVRMYALLCSFWAVGVNRSSRKAKRINILQLISIWN